MNPYFMRVLYFFIPLFFFSAHNAFAEDSIVTTNVEFAFTQASGFTMEETYSPLWHFKDSTYLIWVDNKFRAEVTQIKNGKAVTVPLDENADYVVQKDGHHRFTLGVDKLGYVHITGDMHNYTDMTTGAVSPYPTRYQKRKILYWRSVKPEDITGKFTFRGDSFDTAMKGSGWMMGRFFADNNGEMYYASHVQAFRSSTNFGQMGVGLYKYNTATQLWTTIGALAPVTDSNLSYQFPVLYWEYSGFLNTQFQNYQPVFLFDKSNTLYFAVTSNTDPKLNGANRLIMAKSEDGGVTWKRANNTLIANLPIRGVSGLASSGDIVLDTGTSNFLEAKPGIAVDKNGKVAVAVQNKWRVWDGSKWSLDNKLNFADVQSPNTAFRLPNNDLAFNATGWIKFLRISAFEDSPIGYDFVGYNSVRCIDSFALRNYGEVYAIGRKSNNDEVILKTSITPAPLPDAWTHVDIDNMNLNFKGNGGFLNNQMAITGFGADIGGQADSFHYAYKKMQGNGEATARVAKFELANGSAGVMMRETLDSNAKEVSQLIYPLTTDKFASFVTRTSTGGGSGSVKNANITPPYWVRIKREGNLFTGFISPDGSKWTQTSSATIPMATDIYVGLASTARRHRVYMDGATFENISVPGGICQKNNPTLTLDPASQSGKAGGSVKYAVTLTNNDSSACSNSDFTLSPTLTDDISGALDVAKLNVAPGSKATTNLTVSSKTTTAVKTYSLSVKAANGTYAASASGQYEVTSACVLNQPDITVNPVTKTTSGLMPIYYLVSLTDKDSVECPARVFNIYSDSNHALLKPWMEPRNHNMAPNQVNEALLTVTPQDGLPVGAYTVKLSTKQGGATVANIKYEALASTVVQVTSERAVYDKQETPYNAVLKVVVLENNKPVGNVPVSASITWPNGKTQSLKLADSGSKTFYQWISKDSETGIYTFTVTANYKGTQLTNNVMFTVR